MNRLGRCETPEERCDILQRLLNVWDENPNLRLGQLIGNYIRSDSELYYIEDEHLIRSLERGYTGKEPE